MKGSRAGVQTPMKGMKEAGVTSGWMSWADLMRKRRKQLRKRRAREAARVRAVWQQDMRPRLVKSE
jgi:hypothetical protein